MERAPRAPAALSRRRLLGGAAAACIGAAVLADEPAFASYAPSSAAVTSTPPQKKLSVGELSRLGEKKKQRGRAREPEHRHDPRRARGERRGAQPADAGPRGADREVRQGAAVVLPAPPSKEQTQSEAALAELKRLVETEMKEREAMIADPEWVNYASAAAASIISTCIMHPVDTIKTKMQTKESAKAAAQAAVDDEVFEGKAAVLLREEPGLLDDVGGLYKGLLGNVFKEAPSSALYLGTGIADGFGDALASIVAEKSRRDQVLLAWSSSLYRDVPMGAIQIAIFEGLKTFILQSPDIVFDVNTLQAGGARRFGGAIGACVTTPTDVITTRIISDASGATEGQSVLDLGRSIYVAFHFTF
ncbi:hypothetical protein JL722_13373 [Aureococcus anophagefferens]|nr:hypothetical protein JL722_13373 [Aureococcus anophagefferens]